MGRSLHQELLGSSEEAWDIPGCQETCFLEHCFGATGSAQKQETESFSGRVCGSGYRRGCALSAVGVLASLAGGTAATLVFWSLGLRFDPLCFLLLILVSWWANRIGRSLAHT